MTTTLSMLRQATAHATALAALLAGLSGAASAADLPARYPGDPLAHDRVLMKPTAIGTARGQVQFSALGALVDGPNSDDIYMAGKLGLEFMLDEFAALRITGMQDLADHEGKSLERKFSSARAGTALHLRPYRRVDLGSYLEGGVLVIDAVDGKTGTKAPEVAIGGFITIHIDSYTFVRMELERAWANVDTGAGSIAQHRTAAMLGLGIAF